MQSQADLKNPGPKSTQWLNAIGVYTRDDLREMGTIEGALRNMRWAKLPATIKQQLKTALAAS